MDISTIREITLLRQLVNPSIISIRDVWLEKGSKLCIKMDYFEFDLGNIIRALKDKALDFSEAEVQYIMFRVLTAVQTLHENFILHRDVKPENFVANRLGEIALIDFGLAR